MKRKAKRVKRARVDKHAVDRMKVYVCRDGTRTCAAVMSSSHIAYALGSIIRGQDRGQRSGDERKSLSRDDSVEFVPILLKELNNRLKAKTLIEPEVDSGDRSDYE